MTPSITITVCVSLVITALIYEIFRRQRRVPLSIWSIIGVLVWSSLIALVLYWTWVIFFVRNASI